MKENHFLTSSVLLISIVGVLTLSASAYVNCRDFYPDEFLDLGLACQPQILPVLSLSLNTHPLHRLALKTLYFQRVNFLTTFMRC
jgi:hypothetical protein